MIIHYHFHQVHISLSEHETDVAQPISVIVDSHPNSYVGLLGVDQSVLLLDKGNDITEDRIFKDLSEYETSNGGGWGRYWWGSPSLGTDATEVFHVCLLL